jgi:hypothetical protein
MSLIEAALGISNLPMIEHEDYSLDCRIRKFYMLR